MLQMCMMKNANLAERPGKTIQRIVIKPKKKQYLQKSNEIIWHIVQPKKKKNPTEGPHKFRHSAIPSSHLPPVHPPRFKFRNQKNRNGANGRLVLDKIYRPLGGLCLSGHTGGENGTKKHCMPVQPISRGNEENKNNSMSTVD